MERYRASYYNMRVPNGAVTLLFNGVSGALLALDRKLAQGWAPFLGNQRDHAAGTGYNSWNPQPFTDTDLPESIARHLPAFVDAGIFISENHDERAALKASYVRNRTRAPFFVTITTTLDCNMRCYYCYQKEGMLEHMSVETCDEIITWTKRQIDERGYSRLYVDWYGGEPMLNQSVIERYTSAVTRYCDSRNIEFKASMICNGTAWPVDPVAFIKRNRLHSIQFSLDGPERHHNKRRGLIDPNGGSGRSASFNQIMSVIDALIGSTKIYLRVNIDPWTGRDALEVIDLCAARGWLAPDTKFYPYVALINAMTEHCGFVAKAARFQAFESEFDEIQRDFYAALRRFRDQRSLEVVQYFPNRVTINCAAVSDNAVVFGPNGLAYKCGLDVGDHHRAHAAIGKEGALGAAPPGETLPADRWQAYDPFAHPRCSECQYHPVCMGGCPKAQIDNDAAQIRMQSAFWENNFERIIREYYAAAGHA